MSSDPEYPQWCPLCPTNGYHAPSQCPIHRAPMSDPEYLSDAKVAACADGAYESPDGTDWPVLPLAREVQHYRAIRAEMNDAEWADLPRRIETMKGYLRDDAELAAYRAIPTPEGVPLAQWVQTLVETLRQADCWLAVEVPDAVQARIDAVLKMAGES